MTTHLKIAIELAVMSFIVLNAAFRLNKPYPWNSVALDYVEGLGAIIFIPTFIYALAAGIWLL